ncbi:hypothetical protein Gorai_014817 [Gossypium raimondii]|uniref:Uncharacterized protein n=1 Tax=Gossypium raimondii TaxID=29730 RepID=A0A7J8P4Z1_GOSRA|nr:hypothetical protein [Gossypium raimondii]
MSSGEKSLRNFHLHLPHLHHHHHQGKKQTRDVPKGYLAIMVGSQGEERQRFVVPVMYFNHPLFMRLLKEAEEEYGFDQKGTITIPCHVEEFRNIRGLIDKEKSLHHHHHHHHVGCFRMVDEDDDKKDDAIMVTDVASNCSDFGLFS